jgi:uncharacterized membrane protein
MLSVLRSRAVHGPLFLVSFLAFVAAVYAQASWLQHLGAAVGIGCGITGCAGLWGRRRARRDGAPESD